MSDPQIGAPRIMLQGGTTRWRVRLTDYAPSDWTLTATFISETDKQTITASDYGDGSFLIDIDSTAAAEFLAGAYRYQYAIEDAPPTERHFVGSGVILVQRDFAAVSDGYDGRSHAARMYDQLTERLEEKAGDDIANLAQEGYSLSRYQWEELDRQRGQYAHAMTDEERIARGFKPRRARRVGFDR